MASSLDQLQVYLQNSIERVRDGEIATVAEALRGVVPELLPIMVQMLKSSEVSSSAKVQVLEMILSLWSRCITTDIHKKRHEAAKAKHLARRAAADAAKAEAKAQERAVQLESRREQQKAAKKLARIKERIEQAGDNNERPEQNAA